MSESETVPSGSFKGWTKGEVHSFGAESAVAIDEVRKTWEVIKEDDDKVAYNTGGGIYVEDKKSGRLTRVGDAVATASAGGKK